MSCGAILTHWRRRYRAGAAIGAALTVAMAVSATAPAAERDQPIMLEVVHLTERLDYQASCDVTDGLGTTRTSTFIGRTNSSVRFVGTRVACHLRSPDAGAFQATLRSDEAVLARAQGAKSELVTLTVR